MSDPAAPATVERLFPFVRRAGVLIVGRETLRHSKGKLHFVLVATDLSDSSRAEVLEDFKHYPVVQRFTSEDLERFFGIKNAKVVGLRKSDLAKSVYAELKQYRVNPPISERNQSTGHSAEEARE